MPFLVIIYMFSHYIIKQGKTVHNMLQIATFLDIYSISPPIYIIKVAEMRHLQIW